MLSQMLSLAQCASKHEIFVIPQCCHVAGGFSYGRAQIPVLVTPVDPRHLTRCRMGYHHLVSNQQLEYYDPVVVPGAISPATVIEHAGFNA